VDNTLNIIRLMAETTKPDSVQYRVIGVARESQDLAEQAADSIINAIKAGAPFDTIAKKYNQSGQKVWIASAQYEGMNIQESDRKFIEALTNTPAGTLKKLSLENQSVLVLNVLETRNPVKKYDIAVIKNTVDFSKQTYDKAFSNFSSFLAGKNAEAIDTLADDFGYRILVHHKSRAGEEGTYCRTNQEGCQASVQGQEPSEGILSQ
jgi:peptidyl-prolyl cis-trans isomerase D